MPAGQVDLDRLGLRQRSLLLAGHPLAEPRLDRDQRQRPRELDLALELEPAHAVLDQLDPVGLPHRRIAGLAAVARARRTPPRRSSASARSASAASGAGPLPFHSS